MSYSQNLLQLAQTIFQELPVIQQHAMQNSLQNFLTLSPENPSSSGPSTAPYSSTALSSTPPDRPLLGPLTLDMQQGSYLTQLESDPDLKQNNNHHQANNNNPIHPSTHYFQYANSVQTNPTHLYVSPETGNSQPPVSGYPWNHPSVSNSSNQYLGQQSHPLHPNPNNNAPLQSTGSQHFSDLASGAEFLISPSYSYVQTALPPNDSPNAPKTSSRIIKSPPRSLMAEDDEAPTVNAAPFSSLCEIKEEKSDTSDLGEGNTSSFKQVNLLSQPLKVVKCKVCHRIFRDVSFPEHYQIHEKTKKKAEMQTAHLYNTPNNNYVQMKTQSDPSAYPQYYGAPQLFPPNYLGSELQSFPQQIPRNVRKNVPVIACETGLNQQLRKIVKIPQKQKNKEAEGPANGKRPKKKKKEEENKPKNPRGRPRKYLPVQDPPPPPHDVEIE